LENLLQAKVLIIPDINTDETGHADGHLRFIDNNTVLVNSLKHEYQYWRDGFLKMAKETGLNYVEMPWFTKKFKGEPLSSIGIYVNYLEVGNLIVFPLFEVEGNKDQEALNIISKVFPDKIIETININDIGFKGGLMNCITWNIKKQH
jgi:agmatine deiminase